MKRFTLLTMLVALFSVTAFAQKGLEMKPLGPISHNPIATMKAIARQAQPTVKQSRRAPELVTPPATATVEHWYTVGGKFYVGTSSGWSDYTSKMATIDVAIDGNDIYLQGLAYWFPEAWVKGTISGTTATFENNQFLGEDEYGPEYLSGSDDGETLSESIVFTYDATEGTLEATTKYLMENSTTTELSIYTYWSSPAFSKNEPVKPEPVVAPEGLVAEEYTLSYVDYDGEQKTAAVKIGFDGFDVYVQGICSYLPEAWIKGSMLLTSVSFEGNQFLGTYAGQYDMFFQEEEATFTYNADDNTFKADQEIIYTYTGSQYADYYKNVVMTKVIEKAATPATPSITEIADTQYGPVVEFDIPTVDTEGNGILTSKLGFQFFVDVEGEISPLKFSPDYYKYLDDTLTVIPYGFTEDYDFYSTYIYLNMPEYDTFNKIGIQSIYTGGGEENKSEISWYTIKEYSRAIFDFNAMVDEPCSSSSSSDGDITEPRTFEAGNVALTVSASTANTPNRFWSTAKGPQLRVYGGTLTFEVPATKVITSIKFNAGKWNEGNTADTGEIKADTTWYGEAKTVVITIAGNTQINSIEVNTDDFVPTPITAPEGLTTETYAFTAKAIEYEEGNEEPTVEDYSAQVEVGFDGNDVYIQGIASDCPELWVKATKNEAGQYVIPANQYMGTYDLWGLYVYDYYFTAVDTDGENLVLTDIVFNFDANTKKFTTDQLLALNGDAETLYYYQLFSDVTIAQIAEVAATPVNPTVETAGFSAYGYPCIDFALSSVGTNGETLLSSKLFYAVWVEKDGQQQQYVFTAENYPDDFDENVSEVAANYDGYDFVNYGGGEYRVYFEEADEDFKAWSKIGVQAIYYGAGECHKSEVVWAANTAYEDPAGISTITADLKAGKAVIYNLAGQRLSTPQKGLNIINGRKVVIK